MKALAIILLLLLAAAIADAQPSVRARPLLNGKDCDTCYTSTGFTHLSTISCVTFDIISEFVHQGDTIYKSAVPDLPHASKNFISGSSFRLAFLPSRSGNKDLRLPDWTHDGIAISYTDLEYKVLLNDFVLQDWKSIAALAPEKDFSVKYADQGTDNFKEWPSFSAGLFKLAINDHILISIRKKGTTEAIDHLYFQRLKVFPEPAITQFPSGTGIQDILNKEISKQGTAQLINDELILEPGNAALLSFDRNFGNLKLVEYAYADKPDEWQLLQKAENSTPSIIPWYLYIDKPAAGKTIGILLRYKHQPESVKHIRISVKEHPKLSQNPWFIISASLVLAFLLFIIAYYVNRRKNQRQLKEMTRKKEDLENKLQLLSGQLNPHFLFNTLNSIQNLVTRNETDKANAYISQVAVFLRTVMDAGKKEYISLQEELDIAGTYLQLEQKRRNFTYKLVNNCPISLSQIDFPPLLLQPVLENSIHHGFTRNIVAPVLTIMIDCAEKDIIVTVSDNGQGFDPAQIEKGHGLGLVEKRIALLNQQGNNIQIKTVSSVNGGAHTIFTLHNWL